MEEEGGKLEGVESSILESQENACVRVTPPLESKANVPDPARCIVKPAGER